jgi:hypothetical protein
MLNARRSVWAVVVWASVAAIAAADPLPGEKLKFQQLPMVATPIGGTLYYGHDELSTAVLAPPDPGQPQVYQGQFMADDFADPFEQEIVHVRWWGSYLDAPDGPSKLVDRFLISFESDVPVGPDNPFSHPGTPLLNQVVFKGPLAPASGTFTEAPIRAPDPLLSEALFEYNAELMLPFHQNKDTVYWLKIVALTEPAQQQPPVLWGWHNRDYTVMDPFASVAPAVVPGEYLDGTLPSGEPIWHFQDDAVSGLMTAIVIDPKTVTIDQSRYAPENYVAPFDGPTPIANHSKDLAFELYYVPEPSTLALLAIGLGLLALRQKRRA